MALDRDDVLNGALRILDDEGIEKLSMRRLASSLGVKAGAIYWHFAGKQELLDALIDHVLGDLLEPAPTGKWDEQLAELTRRMARRMAKQRDGAKLMTRGLRPGANALAVSEKMLAIARDAGFSKQATIWATSVLGYYVLGYVTDLQATDAARRRGDLDAILRALAKNIDRQQFPQLAGFGEDALEMMTTPRQFEARFEFGLDVIFDGLRSALRTQKRRTPSSRWRRRPKSRG